MKIPRSSTRRVCASGRGVRSRPKGRQVDPDALAEVRALLGDAPRERRLLIEFLHRIQDARGYLAAAHLVALAQEMKLAMTEVYEVATFYHHFDVVDDDEAPPPPITVRVCETLSCQMAGGARACATRCSRTATRRARARRAVHRPLRAGAGRRRRPQPDRSRDAAAKIVAAIDARRTRTADAARTSTRRLSRATAAIGRSPHASTASATSRR